MTSLFRNSGAVCDPDHYLPPGNGIIVIPEGIPFHKILFASEVTSQVAGREGAYSEKGIKNQIIEPLQLV